MIVDKENKRKNDAKKETNGEGRKKRMIIWKPTQNIICIAKAYIIYTYI